MSHIIRSVSFDPDANLVPVLSNVSAVTAPRCPLNMIEDDDVSIFHIRIDPSAYLYNQTNPFKFVIISVEFKLC
jgi:hypothetical protein